MRFLRSEILAVRHIRAYGFEATPNTTLTGVSTDSRTTKPGDVFFAIRGEKFDAHDFITKAIGTGAGAVVVDRKWADANGTMLVSIGVPRLVVEDTTVALGNLAALYRRKFDIPFVAIAGSNGKTTTKNMVTAVLGTRYNVLSTEGNLNNQIGVPQTLFRLTEEHDVAVVEIGTNHFGELEYLCKILAPTHGLITNIGREHLEFFGSLDGVARAEGELLESLRSNKGTFFLNKDDDRLTKRARKSRTVKTVTYGLRAARVDLKGTIHGTDERGNVSLKIRPRGKKALALQLNVPGEQNAQNALAAATVGLSMKVPGRRVVEALSEFTAAGKRSEVIQVNGLTILNDSYNANPDSVLAALRTLRLMKTTGRRVAVLGDMLELGKSAAKEHQGIGKSLGRYRVDCLFTFGKFSRALYEAATVSVKAHFTDKAQLAKQLGDFLTEGDVVLVKGSRGMRMEEVIAHLQQGLQG